MTDTFGRFNYFFVSNEELTNKVRALIMRRNNEYEYVLQGKGHEL